MLRLAAGLGGCSICYSIIYSSGSIAASYYWLWTSCAECFLVFYVFVPLGMIGFFCSFVFSSDCRPFSRLRFFFSMFFRLFCCDFSLLSLPFGISSFFASPSLTYIFSFIFTIYFFSSSVIFNPVTTKAYFSKKFSSPLNANYMSLGRFCGPYNESDWNMPLTLDVARISILATLKPSLRSWSFLKLWSQLTNEYKSTAKMVHLSEGILSLK